MERLNETRAGETRDQSRGDFKRPEQEQQETRAGAISRDQSRSDKRTEQERSHETRAGATRKQRRINFMKPK